MVASSLLEKSAISSSVVPGKSPALLEERGAWKQADIYKENASRGYKEANNASKKDSIHNDKSPAALLEPTVATLLAGRVTILQRYLLVLLLAGFRQLCRVEQGLKLLTDPESDQCRMDIQSKSAEVTNLLRLLSLRLMFHTSVCSMYAGELVSAHNNHLLLELDLPCGCVPGLAADSACRRVGASVCKGGIFDWLA